jgi:glycerophosphoryl diester phosphodiesterase
MQVIAHRGASGHAPENTLAAFRLALEMGAQAFELDVHQTRDGELIVIHDDDFKRVGGRKAKVGSLSLGEAQAIDVGSWMGNGFGGERAPTLAQVFDLAQGRAEIHVEIKHGTTVYPGIEARVLAFIERRRALDRVLISSFDHRALFSVRGLEPRARIGYLLGLTPMPKAWREMEWMRAESLNISQRQASVPRIRAAHDRGLKVLVYTVNKQQELDRLCKLGADGAFCNYPELKVS